MLTAAIDHLWQSTLFLAVIALAARWLKSDAASVRSALWTAASVKFLVPLSLLVAAGSSIPIDIHSSGDTRHVLPADYVLRPLGVVVDLAAGPSVSRSTVAAGISLASGAIALWLFGVVALLVHRTHRLLRIRRIVNAATHTAVRGSPIPVRITRAVDAPAVAGVVSPVLLLPHGLFATLSDAELDAVLAHELEHVRRRDNLIAHVHGLVEIVFWFYPPVWWLGHQLVLDRERACDEAVISDGYQRAVYAEAILKICERFCGRRALHGAASATDSDLQQRIEAIMNHTPTPKLHGSKVAALCLVFGTATLGPIATGLAAPKEPAQQDSSSTLLGRHTINLRLVAIPAAQAIQLLSSRSKAIAQMPQPPADEGRAWEASGLEQLDGLFVKVDFTETSVAEVVRKILGCSGFGFAEQGDRIEIVRVANALPRNECGGVETLSSLEPSRDQARPARVSYSWQLESVAALDFIRRWSAETGHNIMVTSEAQAALKQIHLQVNASNADGEAILAELTKCIGWTYEKLPAVFTLSKPERPVQSQCGGFVVL